MTRRYMSTAIDRNMNGKWIVTYANGSHIQHITLADTKTAIEIANV